jgi:hypothetical protein
MPRQTVLQLKRADIDTEYTLPVSEGKITKSPAKRTPWAQKRLNQLAAAGGLEVVDGADPPFRGGHLLKAEYGGPDDETNVVPWYKTMEEAYGLFESWYESEIQADNTVTAVRLSTKAKFKQPSRASVLALSDPNEPTPTILRDEHVDDVADMLSEIPDSVRVQVSWPTPSDDTDDVSELDSGRLGSDDIMGSKRIVIRWRGVV